MSQALKPRLPFAAAGLLGVAAALLVSCGSSGNGLIPSAAAGPLQSDFEEVLQAAQNGGGSCAATEAAIAKTDADFAALPSTVAVSLRLRLREGIFNLRKQALVLCKQPSSATTVTSTSPKTTPTTTSTPTQAQTTTTTQSTPTTHTTPTEPGPGGPSPAPGPGGAEASPGPSGGQGAHPGEGAGGGGGAGAGGGGAGNAGGQEAGK